MALRELMNYINGEWTPSSSGKTFPDVNPANTDDVIGTFQDSEPEDVCSAIDAAERALPSWQQTPSAQRAEYLKRAGSILKARLEQVSAALTREEGKTLSESRGEVQRSVQIFEFYAGQGLLLTGETFPSENPNTFVYTKRCPLGVVALITPWNFPSAIPVWKLAPALLCGNTVVLKPSSPAPWSSQLLAEIMHEAELPPGVLNMVTGQGRKLSNALIADPRVKGISFTGSCPVGKAILRQAAERGIRVGLEMGGKNPIIVDEDADIDLAVDLAVKGAMWSAGEKCTATSRAIIPDTIHDEFVRRLIDRVDALRVGDGMDSDTEVCPVIDHRQMDNILDYIRIGRGEGAKLACGGKRLTAGSYDKGFFIQPTVFVDVKPDMRIAQEEIFGPVLSIIRVPSFEQAIVVANNIRYGLSASLVTRNIGKVMAFVDRIETGVIHINSTTSGLEVQAPFGGMKDSTSGYREMGKTAIDFYSQWKTIYLDAPK